MRVLHLNKSDIQGGAARAAYRLHSGLRRIEIDSRMLVDNKISDDSTVSGPAKKKSKTWSKIQPMIDKLPLKFYNHQGTPFNPAWFGRNISKEQMVKEADVINLHWITEGFLSIGSLSKLYKLKKPIVWTLHDMWAFTGGCHYSGNCERYINSCGSCPQLNSKKRRDITRWIWKKKKKAYKDLNLTIVTPSKWMAECAEKSSLLSEFRIEIIPNGLDTDLYKPIDKHTARKILNLPKDKKIILFESNYKLKMWKTFDYLKEMVEILLKDKLVEKHNLCIIFFGASNFDPVKKLPIDTRFLGRFYDDYSLALIYSAVDVFMTFSLQDNLPNTVMESLACGTPVIGFKTGGIPDMVEHKENGYLAEYKNSQSLAEGINWILEDENRLEELGKSAREKALKEYSLEIQAKRYAKLYEKLLERRGKKRLKELGYF